MLLARRRHQVIRRPIARGLRAKDHIADPRKELAVPAHRLALHVQCEFDRTNRRRPFSREAPSTQVNARRRFSPRARGNNNRVCRVRIQWPRRLDVNGERLLTLQVLLRPQPPPATLAKVPTRSKKLDRGTSSLKKPDRYRFRANIAPLRSPRNVKLEVNARSERHIARVPRRPWAAMRIRGPFHEFGLLSKARLRGNHDGPENTPKYHPGHGRAA